MHLTVNIRRIGTAYYAFTVVDCPYGHHSGYVADKGDLVGILRRRCPDYTDFNVIES